MAPKRNNKKIEHSRRLKELKQKLKPYRNKDTVNLLRVITGSCGVNLDNYWESLESVLTGEHSQREVKERIQSVVNRILENGEYAKSGPSQFNFGVAVVDNTLTHLQLNSQVKVSNWRNFNIDSRTNVFDNVRHGNIDSKANDSAPVRNQFIDSKANVSDHVTHGNIDSKANDFAPVRNQFIDSKANVSDHVTHGNIDSKANVFDNV